jgi:hypothetical protein
MFDDAPPNEVMPPVSVPVPIVPPAPPWFDVWIFDAQVFKQSRSREFKFDPPKGIRSPHSGANSSIF